MEKYYVTHVFKNGDIREEDGRTKEDAVKRARYLSLKYKDRLIVIACPGNSGQGCYYNPDGNCALTGEAW